MLSLYITVNIWDSIQMYMPGQETGKSQLFEKWQSTINYYHLYDIDAKSLALVLWKNT